ncbi:type II secretion system (T2SS) protein F [Kribbella amoyensis]|uniref:Type II secretion system (T2SS) protein F n=1 Tax=Kribbella amoyensis TaxID=996641 RepID=A0A561BQG6_9ACTN|nr:type II secretion system F family protein [Kribbella amoyensis]TWD81111.1 type II secretion system (T2SS) protein F [Kribbella amoyensis]
MPTPPQLVMMNSASAVCAAVAAAVAVMLLVPGRPGPRRLLQRGRLSFFNRPGTQKAPPPRLHRLVALAAAFGAILLLGFPLGLLAAPAAYYLIPRALGRLESADTRRRAARLTADLPLAVDLLAACLRAGRPPQAALGTVSRALDGPLADLLAEVEHRLTLGTDPADAWSALSDEPPCAPFARAVQRALRSGAPLAKTLEHQADDTRRSLHWAAETQARTVETRAVLPLGLCFLPAFVLLGIVPTVAHILSTTIPALAP